MSGPAAALPEMVPLPPGRHDIPAELVRESQRRRLMTAAAEVLAADGYSGITTTAVAKRARVSTAAFYKHFGDLWACLLGAYEADTELLCECIGGAFADADGEVGARAAAAIEATLALLASDPAIAHLLGTEPPPQAAPLRAARRRLIVRLAALLQSVRGDSDPAAAQWLIGSALALVSSQVRAGGAERAASLSPTLTEILLGPA